MGVGEEGSPFLSALLKAALCSGSNFLVTWQGWACWERHLACALFLLASRSWELVPLNFYKSRICEPPRRRGACGSCGIFFNKTWIRFVLFYFPSSTPLHPPFTLLICSVFPHSKSGTLPIQMQTWKNTPLLGGGRRCGEEWPPPP